MRAENGGDTEQAELARIRAIVDEHGIATHESGRELTLSERVQRLAKSAIDGWAFAGRLRAQRDLARQGRR